MRIKQNLFIVLIAAVAVAGCDMKKAFEDSTQGAPPPKITPQQKQLAGVKTATLTYKVISSVVSCTGEVEVPPQGMASVTAPLGGYIVQTGMVPGAKVKKGTLLATLSNPEYIQLQQLYLETAGQLTFAEQDYHRQRLLEEQNATALKKLQESESSYNVLKARLAGLREQLKLIGINMRNLEAGNIQSVINLRSPIDGFVTAVNHHPGQFVEPREVIFEVVDMRDLHLHLNVFEQDVTSLEEGQTIRFRPAGAAEYTHAGTVSLVSPKKNETERTFDVHAHIHDDGRLKPGMYVEAQVLLNDDSVHAVPVSALVYNDNKPFVLTEEDGSYAEHAVTLGARMDGWVEIRNHQELKDKQIVIEGATRVSTALRNR